MKPEPVVMQLKLVPGRGAYIAPLGEPVDGPYWVHLPGCAGHLNAALADAQAIPKRRIDQVSLLSNVPAAPRPPQPGERFARVVSSSQGFQVNGEPVGLTQFNRAFRVALATWAAEHQTPAHLLPDGEYWLLWSGERWELAPVVRTTPPRKWARDHRRDECRPLQCGLQPSDAREEYAPHPRRWHRVQNGVHSATTDGESSQVRGDIEPG